MSRKQLWLVVLISVVVLWSVYIVTPGSHSVIPLVDLKRRAEVHKGLDLQGGMQVILEAKDTGVPLSNDSMDAAKAIVENRVNALGVAEPLVQRQGSKRIVVELPGVKDPDQAIATFKETGLLEFIDAGSTPLTEGQEVTTSLGGPNGAPAPAAQPAATPAAGPTAATTPAASATAAVTATPAPAGTATASATPQATAQAAASATPGAAAASTGGTATPSPAPTPAPTATPAPIVYKTVLTGKDLKNADVAFNQQTGQPYIQFSLRGDGPKAFGDWTSANVGKYLAIAVDKKIISSPVIKSPITGGEGIIEGQFTLQEAKSLAIQLKYGALPVALDVISTRSVGPTLGQDSLDKSWTAGLIGLGVVMLFMLLYFRLPGLLANLALAMYSLIVFALFKTIPVTLTLAGIAGFILSIGMAVDANVLIFSRMKEELRGGKTLGAAIDAGFGRAWPSIRDANVSTLITCVILYWFGSNFGASIIKGFALTLAIGVIVSMFSAITITRTLLRGTQMMTNSDPRKGTSRRLLWLFGSEHQEHNRPERAEGESTGNIPSTARR